jgi:hypothetical protein
MCPRRFDETASVHREVEVRGQCISAQRVGDLCQGPSTHEDARIFSQSASSSVVERDADVSAPGGEGLAKSSRSEDRKPKRTRPTKTGNAACFQHRARSERPGLGRAHTHRGAVPCSLRQIADTRAIVSCAPSHATFRTGSFPEQRSPRWRDGESLGLRTAVCQAALLIPRTRVPDQSATSKID